MKDEKVLVVPTTRFKEVFGDVHGIFGLGGFEMHARLDALLESSAYKSRLEVEADESWLQIIPYCVIRRFGEKEKLLVYERGTSGDEDRLHAKLSVGIGGHVSHSDDIQDKYWFDSKVAIYNAINREIREELRIEPTETSKLPFFAVIRCHDTPVDRVHLGLVCVVHIPISYSETNAAPEIANPRFASLWDIDLARCEVWSELLVRAMLYCQAPYTEAEAESRGPRTPGTR